ncbi:hypothetical protein D3C81_1968960 [compost metagenome]
MKMFPGMAAYGRPEAEPDKAAEPEPAPKAASADPALDEMRRQMDEMRAQIDRLAGAGK